MMATTSTGALTQWAPAVATTRALEATTAASASARPGPIRLSVGPVTCGTTRATTALGSIARPTCQASQPADSSTAGSAISMANHAAGTDDAATALRTTVALRITSTGRNPSGRRRTLARTAGTPSTSSPAPSAATSRPAEGDCTSSTMPAAVRATTIAPTTSSRAPLPSVVSARHSSGTTRAPRIGSAITTRQPNAASTTPPISGPRQLTAAATPARRPKARPRTSPL